MTNVIEMVSKTEFKLNARGCDYTLRCESGKWAMYVVNAAVHAWRRGYAIPKYFDSLKEVEEKYKSWRGISTLVEGTEFKPSK